MACGGCSKKAGGTRSVGTSQAGSRSLSQPGPDEVLITYQGNVGRHYVFSPTQRGFNYGYYSRGAQFYVSQADQAARPDLFVPVESVSRETVETVEVKGEQVDPSLAPEEWPDYINSAQIAALEASGYTPATAKRAAVDALKAVDGIGPATAKKLVA